MNKAKYSVLIFSPDIQQTTTDELYQYIKNGQKVYFLTFDDPEELLEDPVLREANKKELLNVSVVRYSSEWENTFMIMEDGQINDSPLFDYLEQNSTFNKEQYQLEHTYDVGHCIVKAGAGTGKTTTMINRIMFLKHMEHSLDLRTVVMITFTNEAATHMRSKLLQQLKNYYDLTKDKKYLAWMEEAGDMFIGTIHSFAKGFLVTEGQVLGFSRSMQVRSYKHERRKLIEKYIDQFSVECPEIYERFRKIPHYQIIRSFTDMIEQIHNKSIPVESIQRLDFGIDIHGFHEFANYVIKRAIQELDEQKKVEETLEISDLISRLVLLKDLPSDQLRLSIRYLFVDEFQDTDESQVAFVSWLVEKYRCQLFAVGDIKQSIYRFRGADYTAFRQLQQQLKTANQEYKEYSLRKNYRSTPTLLKQFNVLFQKWTKVVEKFQFDGTDKLIPVQEESCQEGLVTLHMDDTALKYLLRRLYNENVAVLVRSNSEVFEMVEKIENLGFFCEATLSGAFYRSLPVREFYLLLRRLTHPKVPKDRYLFHQSSYGENELTISKVLSAYTPEKPFVLDLLETFDRLDDPEYEWNTASTIAVLQKIIDIVQPHEVFRLRYYGQLRTRFPDGDIEMQKKEAIAKMKEYKMNLDRLIYLLKKEFGDFQASLYDLEKFLSIKMATDTTENELKLESNVSHRIKVMTVHKAKGLEFDYVLMPLTQSAFIKQGKTDLILVPNSSQWKMGYRVHWNDFEFENNYYHEYVGSEKMETIAEEARLLYVALTRARKAVYTNSFSQMNPHQVQCWSDLLESGEMLVV